MIEILNARVDRRIDRSHTWISLLRRKNPGHKQECRNNNTCGSQVPRLKAPVDGESRENAYGGTESLEGNSLTLTCRDEHDIPILKRDVALLAGQNLSQQQPALLRAIGSFPYEPRVI